MDAPIRTLVAEGEATVSSSGPVRAATSGRLRPRADGRVEDAWDAGAVIQIGELELTLDRGHPPPAELPARVPGVTGRSDELARVVRAATGGRPAVEISGPPGSGKTALAVEAAHALTRLHPDGQMMIELHGYDGVQPPTAHEVLGRVLTALGLPNREIAAERTVRADRFREILAGRRMLLLLDDAAAPTRLRGLLPLPRAIVRPGQRAGARCSRAGRAELRLASSRRSWLLPRTGPARRRRLRAGPTARWPVVLDVGPGWRTARTRSGWPRR